MGRTTFEPALNNDRWPWPDLDVFVLGSELPPGVPDHVVPDHDPVRLLEKIRSANKGGDVHLVGGPRTIEIFRALGALDQLELVVLPVLFGGGGQLTPTVSTHTGLTLENVRAFRGDRWRSCTCATTNDDLCWAGPPPSHEHRARSARR